MSGRRWFRLVDLIVVLGIMAILIGLLLPSVRRVREPANRTRSQNNIRQIGIAIQNYHDANDRKFPLLCDYGEGATTGHGVTSLFFNILPQMEASSTYNLMNAESPVSYYDSNNGLAKVIIKAYLSPADPTTADGTVTTIDVTAPTAVAPYAGTFTGTYATMSYAANGMLFVPAAGIKSMSDGTSNTIMLAERYQACQQSANSAAVYNLWGLGAYGASTPAFALQLPDDNKYPTAKSVSEQFVPTSPVPAKGEIAGHEGKKAAKYSDVNKTASAPGGFQVAPRGSVYCDPRVPQTPHTGGMIVCMGDVSTRTIAGNISPNTFWAAVTPAGNEELGTDW